MGLRTPSLPPHICNIVCLGMQQQEAARCVPTPGRGTVVLDYLVVVQYGYKLRGKYRILRTPSKLVQTHPNINPREDRGGSDDVARDSQTVQNLLDAAGC
jgi:hypothetical protein